MIETRVRPDAFTQANAVRRFGIGVTGLVSVLSGATLAAVLVILFLAIGMTDQAAAPFLPAVAAAVILSGYLVAAPPLFARWTRATTADVTGGWLLGVLAGYGLLWAGLLAVL